MGTDKLIEKLAKLKAMAEGAKAIGSEAEAQAFASVFQALLSKHKIDATDVEFAAMEKEEPVETHRIDYKQYPEVRVRNTRVEWIQTLAGIVARAHFCQILVHRGSSRITLVGRKSDCLVAEYMLVTLQRAVEKISGRAYDAYRNEERRKNIERYGDAGRRGSIPWTFGFRDSFIDAFIRRLQQRYEEERRATSNESSTALVRINKSDAAVTEFVKKNFTSNAKALSVSTRYNSDGRARGTEAANAVDLRGNAVSSGARKSLA